MRENDIPTEGNKNSPREAKTGFWDILSTYSIKKGEAPRNNTVGAKAELQLSRLMEKRRSCYYRGSNPFEHKGRTLCGQENPSNTRWAQKLAIAKNSNFLQKGKQNCKSQSVRKKL